MISCKQEYDWLVLTKGNQLVQLYYIVFVSLSSVTLQESKKAPNFHRLIVGSSLSGQHLLSVTNFHGTASTFSGQK